MNGEHKTGANQANRAAASQLPYSAWIKLPMVETLTSMSRSAILKKVKDGHFVAPVKINGGTFWVYGEVMEWIEQRVREYRNAGKTEITS